MWILWNRLNQGSTLPYVALRCTKLQIPPMSKHSRIGFGNLKCFVHKSSMLSTTVLHSTDARCESPAWEGKPGGHATRKRSLFAPSGDTLLLYISQHMLQQRGPGSRHGSDTCGFCAGDQQRGTQAQKHIDTCVLWDPICGTHVPWEPPLCGTHDAWDLLQK